MKTQNLHFTFLCILVWLAGSSLLGQSFTKIKDSPVVMPGYESMFCTWADFDNDGDEDLFVSNGQFSQQENQLFQNGGPDDDFTFTPVPEGDIVTDKSDSKGTSWGDYDNDGDLDLFVAGCDMGLYDYLYENNGDGSFTRIVKGSLVQCDTLGYTWTAGWVDYDNDSYLDLFLGDARGPNYLFKGRGDELFTPITEGPLTEDPINTYGHAWCDFDNDGDRDLITITSFWNNRLYINEGGGTFSQVPEDHEPIANDKNYGGSGCSWIDYDNDGDWDLCTGSFWADSTNNLYRNEGPESNYEFVKIKASALATDSTDYSGNCWADFDNDGDIDCFVYEAAALNKPFTRPQCLYSNNGDGSFTKIATGTIELDTVESIHAAWADYDNDGDMDLYVCHARSDSNLFYRNENNNGNSWIKLKLKGTASNAAAIGAVIKVKATTGTDPVWQMRQVNGPGSLIAHFGLGNAPTIDSIIIQWPAGHNTILTNVTVNQLLPITEEYPDGYLRAKFDADATIGYEGLEVQFTDISLFNPADPITSWEWNFGDGSAISTEQNPSHTYSTDNGESFDVMLVISNGIETDTLIWSKFINLIPSGGNLALQGTATASSWADALSIPQEAIDGDNTCTSWIAERNDVEWFQIDLGAKYNIGSIVIQWGHGYGSDYIVRTSTNGVDWCIVYLEKDGDGSIDTLWFTGIEAQYVKWEGIDRGSGSSYSMKEFEVYLTDGNEYEVPGVSDCILSIDQYMDMSNGISIYPNPAGNELNIEMNQPITQDAVIDITDLTGKLIGPKIFTKGSYKKTIDLSGLAKGLYILKISADDDIIVKKFIKN